MECCADSSLQSPYSTTRRSRGPVRRRQCLIVLSAALIGVLHGVFEGAFARRRRPSADAPPVVGFYNVFSQGEEYPRIVEEQVYQLTSAGLLDKAEAVFYTATGLDSATFRVAHDKFVKMTPESDAEEEVTLERMHKFCQRVPEARVFYFHTKGAFHSHSNNENMRRLQMRFLGEQADDCLAHFDRGYNLCGMRFSPTPHFHFPANFFWATCDYVKDLVSPLQFRLKPPPATMSLDDKCVEAEYGRGRYASEHWIAMHPAANAVDCMPNGRTFEKTFTWGTKRLHGDWTADCQPAPRESIRMEHWVIEKQENEVTLYSDSNEDRLTFLRQWNSGCRPSIRLQRNWELEDLYGEELLEAHSTRSTSNTRWDAAVKKFCSGLDSFTCDNFNRIAPAVSSQFQRWDGKSSRRRLAVEHDWIKAANGTR